MSEKVKITEGDFDLLQRAKEADGKGCVFAINVTSDGRIYVEFHGSEEVSLVEVDLWELEEIAEMFVKAIPVIKQKLKVK